MKLNEPLSSYIWCILESLKNKALLNNSAAKEKKNKKILIIPEL